jgi:predicted glycoside hydrolase/deacetylase ChbG (UPF0249 family)
LIIVADDFGLSDDVNAAIVEAFDRGLITHTSVIANLPAFERACELAHEHGLTAKIGVHLNLTEGETLTEPIRSCRRFCDDQGHFRLWRAADRAFRLHRAERDAVTGELRTQILRCGGRGIAVTHLDSHKHVHGKRAIGRIVISLARELGVPRVRLAHNCGTRIGFANRVYKAWLVNRGLRRAGLAGTRWYGTAEDYRHLMSSGVPPARLDSIEVNCHPIYRNGLLVDLDHPDRPLENLLG